METRLPTSPQSKEVGSRGSTTDQETGTMVAQAGSTATDPNINAISRSMTRYKGNRRGTANLPHPIFSPNTPEMPATHNARAQDLPAPDRRDFPVRRQAEFSQQGEIKPRRRARSIAQSQAKPDRLSRGAPKDRREEATVVELNRKTMSKARDHKHPTQELAEGDESVRSQTASRDMEDGETGAKTQPRQDKRNTIYIAGRTEERTLRPTYRRSAKSQEGILPLSKPVPMGQTAKETSSTFSQRMEKQMPRPLAFETSNNRAELKRMISGPIPIEPQPPPISIPSGPEEPINAPRFDAPISAVNAGSRMVRVKHEEKEVAVPITPSTTPVDIIRSTARQLAAPIDERSTVLLESFKQVGLERPLRKYEHIRDVLNSWDYDAQNTLVIVASPTGGKDDDLDVKNVSKSQPVDTSVYMYYSQKPGHWDKRWITLRSDGQVLVSKKNGGETANICHLSDFDIYIPTPRYASKKIKPPKKVCFAVKSQQKSSMFISTANFVHFFSTSDRQLATSWYKAVQEWRSWYLVNIMGEGQRVKDGSKNEARNGVRQEAIKGTPAPGNQPQSLPESNGQMQYAHSMKPTSLTRSPTTKAGPSSQTRKLTKDPITSAATTNKSGPSFIQQPSAQAHSPDPFAPTSLLGRTYTQRQKAQHRSSPNDLLPPLPPSILAQASTAGVSTTNIKRTSSTRRPQPQPPKPLIDLTPRYQPPPQHIRKGRGVKPEQVPAGGLIEVATSPEVAIQIPPSRDWRRPGTAGGEIRGGRGWEESSMSPPKGPWMGR